MARILTIDDSAVIRNLVKITLESNEKWKVDAAESADEAKHFCAQHQYDLFIVDQIMPGEMGIDFVEQLRQCDNYEDTPIVMLTSESNIDIKSKAKSLDVLAWINKPFQPQTLIKLVAQFLEEDQSLS